MRRITVAAVIVLIAMAATVNAQQGTADLRGRIVDSQQAVMPGVTVTVRNQENGTFRTTVSGVDGSFFISAMNPGVYQVEAMLDGFRPYQQNDVRLEVGRTVSVDVTLELGGIEERLTVTRRGAARGHDLEGSRRQHQCRGVRQHAIVQPQLLGLPRHGPGDRVDGLHVDVRRRHDQRRRPGRAKRQLHDGRVGQQRRSDRRRHQFAGARADRGGAGVQGVDQPVRRRVPAAPQARSSTPCRSRAPTSFTAAGSPSTRIRTSPRRTISPRRAISRRRRPRMQQYGGTIGGPIVRDKMHFFFSVERILFDNGVTVNVPTRPDLNRNEFG